MHEEEHLLEALARRAARYLPAADWAGIPVAMERRTLTLLYVDRPDATPVAECATLDLQLEWLAARHHGIRDRFAPDGALVFFDDAVEAMRMALALQRHSGPVRLRMGLATASCQLAGFSHAGEAYVTLLGAEDELAARVASAATGGSILISPSTYTLVRDAVHADSRDCLLAEELDTMQQPLASITRPPQRGGMESSTFAGLGS